MTRRQLSDEIHERISAFMDHAHAQNRETLFEHEIYQILDLLGFRTPVRTLIADATEVTADLLAGFGSEKVVIKAVSCELTHKQQAGGVQVVYKDTDFVRFSVERMQQRMTAQKIRLNGILLVEHVDYSLELGREVLLGFRESVAFGPVISLSKGGTDAEHFARYFSAPNLILAPINRKWAHALLASTHIQEKYRRTGHADFIPTIVDACMNLSDLATGFSNFFPGKSPWVISEFEVNPFVFANHKRFMALDGFARFAPRNANVVQPQLAPQDSMQQFFKPDGIAVVGVSTSDANKPGNIIAANLFKMGRSDIFCINRRGGRVEMAGAKRPIYRDLMEIGRTPDLVVVAVPAAAVLVVVRQAARMGVRAMILIPGGFSETEQGQALEPQVRDVARNAGMRVMGPNCLGIFYTGGRDHLGLNTFFIPEDKFSVNLEKEQNVAILSQSGALGLNEIYNLRHAISPKVVVSYGNQLDVDPCDLVQYFQDDSRVDVIGCYIEGFKPGGGRRFFDIAGHSKKPIIVYKAGRTEAGRRATESHTASIAGEYAVARAALKQAGLVVADTMMDHGELIKTFTLLNEFTVSGNRVAIVANAGYEKTYAADNLGQLVLADLDQPTRARLQSVLPPMVSADPLLDLTPMADDAMFEASIEALLQSDRVDAVLISIVPFSALIHTTDREMDLNEGNVANRIVRLAHRHRKPVVVSVSVTSGADAMYNRLGQTLDRGGVPTFLTANRAMACLNAFVRHRLLQQSGEINEMLK